MEKKTCLECGEKIAGRADKKFCSDLCRNAYNNKLNSDTNNHVRNINNILRKNRRILEELLPDDKATVTLQTLTNKGFNFKYYTNALTTRKGDQYIFCYEYGYLPLENNFYLLVKRIEKD